MPTRADFQSGYAPSGAARIYFEASGVGPGLVFVHAGVSDSRMWEPQFDTFAAKYRVVRYDHRGFGKSKMPGGPYALLTGLALFDFDKERKRFRLRSVHRGATSAEVK